MLNQDSFLALLTFLNFSVSVSISFLEFSKNSPGSLLYRKYKFPKLWCRPSVFRSQCWTGVMLTCHISVSRHQWILLVSIFLSSYYHLFIPPYNSSIICFTFRNFMWIVVWLKSVPVIYLLNVRPYIQRLSRLDSLSHSYRSLLTQDIPLSNSDSS